MSAVQIVHLASFGANEAPYHVHGAACKDLHRYGRRIHAGADVGPVESHESLEALVLAYCSHNIAESGDNDPEGWRYYTREFRVFPCVGWPKEKVSS